MEGEIHQYSVFREPDVFGCSEYKRACHMKCPQCEEFVCCRIHHNELHSSHKFDRFKVTTMRCNYCMTEQPVSAECAHCGKKMAEYYCDICHLFNTLPEGRSLHHCEKCGNCREFDTKDKDTLHHCEECDCCVTEPHTHFKKSESGTFSCSFCGDSITFEKEEKKSIYQCLCGHLIHYDCMKNNVMEDLLQSKLPACRMCCEPIIEEEKLFAFFAPRIEKYKHECECKECDKHEHCGCGCRCGHE